MGDLVNYLSSQLPSIITHHIKQLAPTVPTVPTVPSVPTCRHGCPGTPKRTGSFYFQPGLLRNPTHPLLNSFLNLFHPRTCLIEPTRN